MRRTITSLVQLLLVTLFHDVLARLPLPVGKPETLEVMSGALASLAYPRCSVILFTDGSTSSPTMLKVLDTLVAPSGVSLFEVSADFQEGNATYAQLSLLVAEARRLRQLSWCVSVMLASKDPAFLEDFARWALKGRLLVWSTRLLLFTHLTRQQLQDIMGSHFVFSSMNALVINMKKLPNNFRYDVYAHLPYGSQGAQTLQVASWTAQRGLLLTTRLQLFPDKFSDLHGGTVDVAATTYKPLWFEVEEAAPNGTTVKRLSGMDYLLLETIAKTLNFTFNVVPVTYWSEALQLTSQRKVFLTPVYHTLLYHRLEYIEFTLGYTYAFFSFAMAKPKITPNWLSMYNPLAHEVWASIIGALMLVTAILYMMVHVRVNENAKGVISTTNIFHTTVGTLVGENLSEQLPTNSSCRLLVAAWLVFAFIIGTAYQGNLTAALTLPRYPPRPETIEELVNTVDKVTVMPWGKDFIIYFKSSGSPLFQRLADLLDPGYYAIEGLSGALLGNQAHMETIHKMQQDIADHFTMIDGMTPLYIGRESMLPGLSALPIPHDAPYRPQLDRCISSVVEAGLYEKWTEDMLDLARKDSRARQREKLEEEDQGAEGKGTRSGSATKALTLTHLQGPLLLLLLGLLVSLLTFSMERLVTGPHIISHG